MAKLSASKAEVNATHNSDVHKIAHAKQAHPMGKRYSYSGRGAQTGVIVGSHSGSAVAAGRPDDGHTGHFEGE